MEKNHEKEARYAALKGNLSKALRNKFWFEACMIEYAIIEDRTFSILYYAKVTKNESKMLKTKLNSINHQIGKLHPVISKKVDSDLIDSICKWRERRNNMVHRACNLFDADEAEEVALEGKILADKISNCSAKVKRLAAKLENQEN